MRTIRVQRPNPAANGRKRCRPLLHEDSRMRPCGTQRARQGARPQPRPPVDPDLNDDEDADDADNDDRAPRKPQRQMDLDTQRLLDSSPP